MKSNFSLMKWIKSRELFLEAKIKKYLSDEEAKVVSDTWGSKYLEYEEVDVTDNIKQGMWKLSDDDKYEVLNKFFEVDIKEVENYFKNLPKTFIDIVNKSIDLELMDDEENKRVLKNMNIESPTIEQISLLFKPIFKKLNIKETESDIALMRDEDGKPIFDEDGKPKKIKKEKGEPVFTKNLININRFIEDHNVCYDDKVSNNDDILTISNIYNEKMDNHKNNKISYDFDILNNDLYLKINHNPKDILNMSVSKFFTSCQFLYSGSSYMTSLLGNVFDPNSIPAFLVYETPIYKNGEPINDYLPLSRLMIRNIINEEANLTYHDKCYPEKLSSIMSKIIKKYSGNLNNANSSMTYIYSPDIEDTDDINHPYMDRLSIKSKRRIGKNVKYLHIYRGVNWDDFIIDKNNIIEELIIDDEVIPNNLTDIKLNVKTIIFRYMTINNLDIFNQLNTHKIGFDKCELKTGDIGVGKLENIKSVRLLSCDLDINKLNFDEFKNLNELELIYTMDNIDEVIEIVDKLDNLKKLTISTDLIQDKESKEKLKELRKKVNIKTEGPKI
jgi:hypothetical protein